MVMETDSEQNTWYTGDWRKMNRKFVPYNGVKISYVPVYDAETRALDHLQVTVTDRTTSELGIQRTVRLGLSNGWVAIEPAPTPEEQTAAARYDKSEPALAHFNHKAAKPSISGLDAASGKVSTPVQASPIPVVHSDVANEQDAATTTPASPQAAKLPTPAASSAVATETPAEEKTQDSLDKALPVAAASDSPTIPQTTAETKADADSSTHETAQADAAVIPVASAADVKTSDAVDAANTQGTTAMDNAQTPEKTTSKAVTTPEVTDNAAADESAKQSDTKAPAPVATVSKPEAAATASEPQGTTAPPKPVKSATTPKPITAMVTPKPMTAPKPMATPKPVATPADEAAKHPAAATDSTPDATPASAKSKATFWRRLRLSSKLLFAKHTELKHVAAEVHGLAAPTAEATTHTAETVSDAEVKPSASHVAGKTTLGVPSVADAPAETMPTSNSSSFTVIGNLRLQESSTWVLLGVQLSYGLDTQRRQALGFIGKVPAMQDEL